MSDETYNGYPTRETWAAALWQDNDEGIYDRVREMAQEALVSNSDEYDEETDQYKNLDDAGARYELARAIEQMWDEFSEPDDYGMDTYSVWVKNTFPMLHDVGSLWRVDWDFIADSVLSE